MKNAKEHILTVFHTKTDLEEITLIECLIMAELFQIT